ncbi:MAG: aspartate carbamoyltransferase regulatory subunit [Candidatus Aenigmarchaeota archaeon]|nr:aspartate carbamoyltransferase regulatory subunit [Candidatus Aenigmarchaeota archaeon]
MAEEFLVRKIGNGTVIDHIPAGSGLKVAEILGLNGSEDSYVVLANVSSSKMGKKDIVKIENRELTKRESDKLSLIAEGASLNIIRDSQVAEKTLLAIPDRFEEIIRCPNTNCITNSEHASGRFHVESKHPLKIRCHYCERVFSAGEIHF